MNRRHSLAALAAGVALRSAARTLRVHRGDSLREALADAHDGDVVEVDSGDHLGQAATIAHKRLTLRGVGARAVLHADGRDAEGKAILVVRDGDITIENLELRGARVPDGNGAGIRFERGRLHVRGCAFLDNEMGLLSANTPDAELIVEDSVFGLAPRHEGALHHLLYVGAMRRFTLRGCHFSGGWRGHLIKSRAREHHIYYNHALDGEVGEASYELDLPNGGVAFVVGNVFGQSRRPQNPAVLSFGAEGHAHADSGLYLSHNTLINQAEQPAIFVHAWPERLPSSYEQRQVNNLAFGPRQLADGLGSEADGNLWLPLDALDAGPRPRPLAARMAEAAVRTVPAGHARSLALTPTAEFAAPAGTRALRPPTRWWPGAHQP